MRRLSSVAASLLLAACYSYAPLDARVSPVGLRVSATLTDQGTAELGTLLGGGVGEVEGSVTASSDSALTLSVKTVRQRNSVESYWKGETAVLPRRLIARLEERRLSRARTTLVGAAGATGLALIAKVFGDRASGGSAPGGGGGTPR